MNSPASSLEQTDAEIVHFAEDDYFYLPGQFQQAVNFSEQNPDADFVAPYEQPGFLFDRPAPACAFETAAVWRERLELLHQHHAHLSWPGAPH